MLQSSEGLHFAYGAELAPRLEMYVEDGAFARFLPSEELHLLEALDEVNAGDVLGFEVSCRYGIAPAEEVHPLDV